jgi:hypothetical protein
MVKLASTLGLVLLVLGIGTGAMADETRQHARGSFEVKVMPVAGGDQGVASGRLSIEKKISGDLTGTSKGDMWTADTGIEGSAGYVAIEKIEGTLQGRSGTFTLLHQGTMRRGGDFQLRIVVVPESGTGQLAGLEGTMTIRIDKAGHFYDFDYTLPAQVEPPPDKGGAQK